jgi:ADP-dependent phosphofructokinase/glucokinase
VKADDWKRMYADLIQSLPHYVRDARVTICGLSTFVDGYVRLHEAEPLLKAREGTPQAALAKELLRRARAGIGGEYYMDWPEGGMWLERNLRVSRWGVGGTGAQAAQTLAILGTPALMNLEDRGQRQLSVIHPNILVANQGGVVKCGELSMGEGEKSAHYIFEFTAGTELESVVLKRSSRTIVRFCEERLDHDPDFVRESVNLSASAGAAILSGFNEIGNQTLDESLEETLALAKAWRERGLEIIHLEVGDFGTIEARNKVLNLLGGVISSLGMSYSELCGLSVGSHETTEKARELAEVLNLSRLCVHSDTWALTITKGDPDREFNALLCGCLLASVRAEKGYPCRPVEVPAHAEFHPLGWEKFRKSGERWVVSCATPYLERPAGTIGLGDTFLAGTLLVLGGAGRPTVNVRREKTSL